MKLCRLGSSVYIPPPIHSQNAPRFKRSIEMYPHIYRKRPLDFRKMEKHSSSGLCHRQSSPIGKNLHGLKMRIAHSGSPELLDCVVKCPPRSHPINNANP